MIDSEPKTVPSQRQKKKDESLPASARSCYSVRDENLIGVQAFEPKHQGSSSGDIPEDNAKDLP